MDSHLVMLTGFQMDSQRDSQRGFHWAIQTATQMVTPMDFHWEKPMVKEMNWGSLMDSLTDWQTVTLKVRHSDFRLGRH